MKNKLMIMGLFLLVMAMPVSAKLYKWVDENGKTHYSDKMPPDQIKNAHQELSNQGVIKEQVDRALTDEERASKAEELKLQRELENQQRMEAERVEKERNALLKSYSSVDQIKRLKNERVSAIQRNIEMAEENLVIQQKNQDDLLKRAADKERSGEVVSETFMAQINQIKDQIEYQKQFIIDKTAEVIETEQKYDNEMASYIKYTQDSGENNTQ